ncbi:hypothetical protein IVB46_12395 [Bradyrhizobium sp. 61]|uniref:hypothetical protein n=1 Tax=unclassified Bradyrhizobium TaxID=2631580 RepID=UPI001FF86861|nr:MULTISPECIES: hypothetical protein [unclassified Bradyrhizobium]MCK1276017.1 hypothetical protein [Bradyrhizobium sp. 61]MCK1465514.1 hypothetical protein [Bradyrhizobium sp. 2]
MKRTSKYASAAGSLLALFAILLLAAPDAGSQDAKRADARKPIPIPKNPTEVTTTSLRDVGFCEVWLISGNEGTGFTVVFYNSMGLNKNPDKMTSCPPDLWATVDPKKLEAEYDVSGVHKLGPRFWTMDSYTTPLGPVMTFGRYETRWGGEGKVPKDYKFREGGGLPPYHPIPAHRKSQIRYEKGKPVFVLEDKEGTPWVMQTHPPGITYDALKTLGDKFRKADGWKYRMVVLDKELVITAPDGFNWLVYDEFDNGYDGCKEGACSFKP